MYLDLAINVVIVVLCCQQNSWDHDGIKWKKLHFKPFSCTTRYLDNAVLEKSSLTHTSPRTSLSVILFLEMRCQVYFISHTGLRHLTLDSKFYIHALLSSNVKSGIFILLPCEHKQDITGKWWRLNNFNMACKW